MKHENRNPLAKTIAYSWRWIILFAIVIGYGLMVCVEEVHDREKCVCSILTLENQTLKIDDRLERVCSIEELGSGTFAIMSIQCEHGYRLWLKIDKDAGTYQGRIVNEEVVDSASAGSTEISASFICI